MAKAIIALTNLVYNMFKASADQEILTFELRYNRHNIKRLPPTSQEKYDK